MELVDLVKVVLFAVKTVRELFQGVTSNKKYAQHILENIGDLEKYSKELKSLNASDITTLVDQELIKLKDAIDHVRSCCKSIADRHTGLRMLDISSEHEELKTLDNQVQRARDCLHLALQLACQYGVQSIKEDLRVGNQKLQNKIHHPGDGVYIPQGYCRPIEVSNVSIVIVPEGDLMEVCWEDWKNDSKSVDNYELYFEETSRKILISSSERKNGCCTVRVGPPAVEAGEIYSIKVRAVNGSGPSEWSKPISIRFNNGPPSRPQKPQVVIESATQISFSVKKLLPKEEGGSEVTQCEFQYMEVCESNENECYWESKILKLKKQTESVVHEFCIGSLKQNTTYRYRIRMINSCGTSDPSEIGEFITRYLIPGTPQNVRLSRNRTSDCLKVRWDPPYHNSEGVHRYKVQYKRSKDSLWIMSGSTSSSKYSKKIPNLKTDTNYDIRVQALNYNDEVSDWSYPVQGETRYGMFGLALSSVSAAIAGTVGAPVIGAVGVGAVAAVVAEEESDSNAGKKAAAVAAGIGGGIGGAILGTLGAPFIGITYGIMANQLLSGKISCSPQNSDDEED